MTSFTCRAAHGSVPSMAKPKNLKVFRTPIGFHDAYVATPTKKAALAAWGSRRNLFAIGEAEQVTDPEMMRAPLAKPGVVVKVSRGTTAEQLRALPPNDKPDAKKPESKRANDPKPSPRRTVAPRPSRAKLDQAEAQLDKLSRTNAKELKSIDEKIEALRKGRAVLVQQHSDAMDVRQFALDGAKSAYHAQMARWRTDS